MYERFGKRLFDIAVVSLAAPFWVPILGLVATLVRLRLGSPVIFKHRRPGLGSKLFVLFKFRTMTDDRDVEGQLLPDSKRLTPLGRWLRASSLDELPELLNVIRGDMSLVGPRPLLVQYLDRYSTTQARRHEVVPGITGWAQVNGRNLLTWDQKFELDLWYVDNISFLTDLKILGKTIWIVFSTKGVSAGDHPTMPEFRGDIDES